MQAESSDRPGAIGADQIDVRLCESRFVVVFWKFADLIFCSFLSKKRLNEILDKDEKRFTKEEKHFLAEHKHLAKSIQANKRNQKVRKEREIEQEDDNATLRDKVGQLAKLIRSHQHIVLYTGAGISTSASIPDYRGPNGVWTQLRRHPNAQLEAVTDLVLATPTFTHRAIAELVGQDIVKYVVSQNCDGLHLRSGLPPEKLSELHGNMYMEACEDCHASYQRSFDVTDLTSLRRHKTGRKCHRCALVAPDRGDLIDTIVHFGEKGKLKHPFNWEAAVAAANQADLIICLGTSLKILRKYACLWPKKAGGGRHNQCKLVIVNLQWTPKDSQAILKLNSRCDVVMQELMTQLHIAVPSYSLPLDPLLTGRIALRAEEHGTCNRIKLEDLLEEGQGVEPSLIYKAPGWFGRGLRPSTSKS